MYTTQKVINLLAEMITFLLYEYLFQVNILHYNKTKALKTSYTNIFSTFFIAGEEGIEPPLTVLETAALPLYYSPIVSAPDYRCTTNEIDYTTGYSCLASKNLFFLHTIRNSSARAHSQSRADARASLVFVHAGNDRFANLHVSYRLLYMCKPSITQICT